MTPTYFYFGDGEKIVGKWNAKLAVWQDIEDFLDFCRKYITFYPLGRPRSGGADSLSLNIETLLLRLRPKEVDKLDMPGLNRAIDMIVDRAKGLFFQLEWLYRPTIYAEDPEYYGVNKEYLLKEDNAHEYLGWFQQMILIINNMFEINFIYETV